MNRWHPLGQLILCRFREFYREPEAVFWVYCFPLLLAIVLGLAFSGREQEPPEFLPLPERNSLVRDPGDPDRGLLFGGPGLDCCNSRTAHQRRNERGS